MAKPASKPAWATNLANIIAPSSGDQTTGWTGAKPPFQWFNWLSYWSYQWILYFETLTDNLLTSVQTGWVNLTGVTGASVTTPSTGKALYLDSADSLLKLKDTTGAIRAVLGQGIYDAIVGSAGYCTHATLAAALADSAVPAGSSILIDASASLAASVTISKANISIEAKPGVTYTDSGAGTGLILGASGIRIKGLRFSGFTAAAVSISNTFNANFVTECRFASCTADVTDNNTTPNNSVIGNITE